MSENPAPGWYADPLRRFDHRYWDGAAWTEHVSRAGVRDTDPLEGAPASATGRTAEATGGADATRTTEAAPGAGPTGGAGGADWPAATGGGEWTPEWSEQRPAGAAGTGTTVNVLAVVSLVLSIIWVGGLASLAAIITGVMARRQIRESGGRETGDGAALAGIVIGGVGVALTLLAVLAMVAFFSISTTPDVAR